MWFAAFFALGLCILALGLWRARKATLAASWPTTSGSIDICELKCFSGGEQDTYEVIVAYSYVVDGQQYVNNRLAVGYANGGDSDFHRKIFNAIKDARRVAVRYNPTSPQDSVLSHGIHGHITGVLFFALVWLFFTGTLAWFALFNSGRDHVIAQNIEILDTQPQEVN